MGKRGRKAQESSGEDEYDDIDMSQQPCTSSAASSSSSTIQRVPRPELVSANKILAAWWDWLTRSPGKQRSQCPFSSNMLNMALQDARLREAVKALPLQWDQRPSYEMVIGGACCCKGTAQLTAAELQAHGQDLARAQSGSLHVVHKALSDFLLDKGYGRERQQPHKPSVAPMAAVEEVAWPPLIELKAPAEYERLIKSSREASRHLSAVAKASSYVPIYTLPGASSREPSCFLGTIVLLFRADTVSEQDAMFDVAVALKEEVEAQAKQPGNIFNSARFLDQNGFSRLPPSARGALEKDMGGRPFEWRKLSDERRRARTEQASQLAKLQTELDTQKEKEREERARVDAEYKAQLNALRQEQEERRAAEERYKKQVDERFSEQSELFFQHSYELQVQQRVAEEREKNMQATLQTERNKLAHLACALEKKELHEQALMQAMEEAMRKVTSEQAERADQLVKLGKESVALELSAAHDMERDQAHKEQLRLKMEAEGLKRKMDEFERNAEVERERNLKELEAQRVAVQQAKENSSSDDKKLAFDMSVGGMLKMADDALRGMCNELQISDGCDTSGRFYYRKLGEINVPLLMHKMGLKPEKAPSVKFEVDHWDKGLVDDIEFTEDGETYLDLSTAPIEHCKWKGADVPHFLAKEAFIIRHGELCGIREEDEVISTNQKIKIVTGDGEVKWHPARPIIIKAEWVQYIRKRFKKRADAILQYLYKLKEEIMEAPRGAQASNYSLPMALWDKQTDLPATPEQKMALFIRGMNLQHQTQLSGAAEGKKYLLSETFAGKSFDDPTNLLLHWSPQAGGETSDAQGETTDS